MIHRSSLTFTVALVFLVQPNAAWADTVATFDTPAELVGLMTGSNEERYLDDIEYRRYVNAAVSHAMKAEVGNPTNPFQVALTDHTVSVLTDPDDFGRAAQMFATLFAASMTSNEIDLYLLIGDSNMAGFTEENSGKTIPEYEFFPGPDTEIKSCMQANAEPGHTVLLLNCARGGTTTANWEPDLQAGSITYTGFIPSSPPSYSGPVTVHNPTRECIESAREIANLDGKRARIKGVFVNVGGADALFHTGGVLPDWSGMYGRLVDFLRTEFGEIPIVHAQVTDPPSYLVDDPLAAWNHVSAEQAAVVSELPATAMVTTDDPALALWDGLQLHFDAASQVELGKQHATAMRTLQGVASPACP